MKKLIPKSWWTVFVIQCAYMFIAMLRQGCHVPGALIGGICITLAFDLLFLAVLAIVVTLASLPEMIRKRRKERRSTRS